MRGGGRCSFRCLKRNGQGSWSSLRRGYLHQNRKGEAGSHGGALWAQIFLAEGTAGATAPVAGMSPVCGREAVWLGDEVGVPQDERLGHRPL